MDFNTEIDKEIAYYKNLNPKLIDLLDFFSRLNQLQYLSIKQPYVFTTSKDDALKQLQQDKYLTEGKQWFINKQDFNNIFREIIKLLKERGEKTEVFENLLMELPEKIPTNPEELIKWANQHQNKLEERGRNTLTYILWQALSIFYQNEFKQFRNIDYQRYWTKATCPVCGNLPKISKLLKDTGKRVLACYLCWTEWPVHRLVCPYCGNKDQDKLSYFYADGNKAYRVDICNACNHYLKTIDEKQLGRETILELEDVITYHLDTLAFSEGYQNPLNLL
ncbi:MAG: formate dehydrogenase accessory protein FdhE [Planctomycetes bacterium]|nr:formate dehydrogenase accessory protein FdhE [Planctomycetota bacterium]